MSEWTSLPIFGVALSIGAYAVGLWVNRELRSPLVNPLLIAIALVIVVLQLFRIPLEDYQSGAGLISLFLGPATASLALAIHRRMDVLKRNLLPVLCGTAVGAAVSMGSVWGLCRLFGLSDELTFTLLPKSVTTPIAMELSRQHGGIVPVTVAAVVFTGILGAVFAPVLIRLLRVKNPVEAGLAIGTASHAVGTTKALELGETEGAMSGIAIGLAGLFTVVYSLFL